MLGCSQPAVANKLRLLKLTQREQTLLIENGFSERHARALLREETEQRRLALLERMIAEHWSIERTEQMAGKTPAPKPVEKPATHPPAPLVKDMRLFFNTLNHAVETMRRSGIDAQIRQTEQDDYMELTVRIPKMTVEKPA